MGQFIFESERLGFRKWKETDKETFVQMGQSKKVMQFFPWLVKREDAEAMADRINKVIDEKGFGLWAVELKETGDFIGFIGLWEPSFEADFTPCIEIGWRLDDRFWNNGYATEGAKACLAYGFKELGLKEIYSFTAVVNTPSSNVMKKSGMKQIGEFMHPRVEDGHILKPHVLYKMSTEDFQAPH